MIWPIWMLLTGALAGCAWYVGNTEYLRGLLAVLAGLCMSRLAVGFEHSALAMMAVWSSVALYLFTRKLYAMAAFAALSSAFYFPLWATFLVADVAGVLMLLCAGGGIYAGNSSNGDRFSAFGPVHNNLGFCDNPQPSQAQEKVSALFSGGKNEHRPLS